MAAWWRNRDGEDLIGAEMAALEQRASEDSQWQGYGWPEPQQMLNAAGGWCAPSDVIYNMDHMIDMANLRVGRG